MDRKQGKLITELLFFEDNFEKYTAEEREKLITLFDKQIKTLKKKNLLVALIDKINNI